MRMPLILSDDGAETYGIISEHWPKLQEAVTDMGIVLLIREGKQAAVHWIRKKFPAKPKELAFLKTDPTIGLLTAEDEHASAVKANRHGVVRKRSNAWIVESSNAPEPLPKEVMDELGSSVREGIVVDANSLRPLTSDYDLAAIVFCERGKRGLTKMSVHPGGGRTTPRSTTVTRGTSGLPTITGGKAHSLPSRKENFQRRIESGKNYSNGSVDLVVDGLNAALGDKRVMHGPVANLDGNPAMNDEKLLVLFPHEHTEIIIANDRYEAGVDLDNLLDELGV